MHLTHQYAEVVNSVQIKCTVSAILSKLTILIQWCVAIYIDSCL